MENSNRGSSSAERVFLASKLSCSDKSVGGGEESRVLTVLSPPFLISRNNLALALPILNEVELAKPPSAHWEWLLCSSADGFQVTRAGLQWCLHINQLSLT